MMHLRFNRIMLFTGAICCAAIAPSFAQRKTIKKRRHWTPPHICSCEMIKPEDMARLSDSAFFPPEPPAEFEGHSKDSLHVPEVYTFVEQMPRFPGDLPAFIMQHLKYPDSTRNNGLSDRIVATFIIASDGSVTDPRIARGGDKYLNAELLRVISMMPKWIPGKQNGIPVNVRYSLPISLHPE